MFTMYGKNVSGLLDSSSLIPSLVSYMSPLLDGPRFVYLCINGPMYKENDWFVERMSDTFSQALMG